MCELFNDVKAALLDGLTDLSDARACDLLGLLFDSVSNAPYLYYADAERVMVELGLWNCLGVIQAYEQSNFGEVISSLSHPCEVADRLFYIMLQDLVYSIYGKTEYFNAKWSEYLSAEDLTAMYHLAEQWFEDNPNGMESLWDNLPMK